MKLDPPRLAENPELLSLASKCGDCAGKRSMVNPCWAFNINDTPLNPSLTVCAEAIIVILYVCFDHPYERNRGGVACPVVLYSS